MTSRIDNDEYDKNCVFNRLLAEKPKKPNTPLANSLERIFRTAKAPDETINVADFLPIY